jgi:hypothetical protein
MAGHRPPQGSTAAPRPEQPGTSTWPMNVSPPNSPPCRVPILGRFSLTVIESDLIASTPGGRSGGDHRERGATLLVQRLPGLGQAGGFTYRSVATAVWCRRSTSRSNPSSRLSIVFWRISWSRSAYWCVSMFPMPTISASRALQHPTGPGQPWPQHRSRLPGGDRRHRGSARRLANHGSGGLVAPGDVRARRRDVANPSDVSWSQFRRVGECRWSNMGLQHAGGNDVNRMSQQAFQFNVQRREIEQIGTRR